MPIMRAARERFVVTALLCLATSTPALAEDVSLDARTTFDITAQPLDSALLEFSEQADLQVMVAANDLKGKQTEGIQGTLTPRTALSTLLKDSGLDYQVVGSTITVSNEEEPGKMLPASSPVPMARIKAPAIQSPSQDQGNRGDDEREALDIEEIVVIGSNIRGVGAVGAASITFTQDELSKTGYSTLAELFESLPQNLDVISPDGGFAEGVGRTASGNTPGATGISLRGLGPGSTLVLLNGKRRPGTINGSVFDVSAIPLSMVERVEVVTGSRSAVYGSDAVAGVVNIVTLREFDGAESLIYYGESSAGGERFNFSQTFGRDLDEGGFVLGYVYREDHPLDATDTGLVRAPSNLGATPIPGLFHLRHGSEQHVGLFSGHYELGEKVELYADAHFSSDENALKLAYHLRGLLDVGQVVVTGSDQYSAAGGVRLDAGEDWQIDLSALYGAVDNTSESTFLQLPSGSITDLDVPLNEPDVVKASLTSFSAIADGPVGELWNAPVSAAIGIDFRNESYQKIEGGPTLPGEDIERDILSAFVEMHLPLIDISEQRLELTLAGRYDHYSDIGGTFNPQFGIEWEPTGGLTFRGSYATAFRAPNLTAMNALNSVGVQTVDDPSASSGTATLLIEFGGNPDLQPEEADTWTVGADWVPAERTKLSVSYFNIDYQGRIAEPRTFEYSSTLQEEVRYSDLINRSPTAEQLDAILDRHSFFSNNTTISFDPEADDPLAAFPNLVVFDNRLNNIALEAIDGLDVQASTVLETQSGDWSFGLNGTYYFDFVRNVTVASPAIGQLDKPGRPVDLRLRGRIGWSSVAWSIDTYIDYVDDYVDTFAPTPTEINSWTTVDVTLTYDVPSNADGGVFKGTRATLGLRNVFDEEPPLFLSNTFGLGYDSANANPVGRFISLRLSKSW